MEQDKVKKMIFKTMLLIDVWIEQILLPGFPNL